MAQIIDERKKAEKRVDDMGTEIARFIAEKLVMEMSQGDNVKLFKKHVSRTDDTGNALGLLSAISSATADIEASKNRPYVVVLTSSPSSQTPSSTTVVLVFGSDEKFVREVGEGLKARLGVKGGGKGTKWSGKLTGVWKKGGREQELEDLLSRL